MNDATPPTGPTTPDDATAVHVDADAVPVPPTADEPRHPQRPRVAVPDVSLVLEGGGMRAAYTSGLISVLLEEGIDLGWVGGISAGSTLMSNYLSRDEWRTRQTFTDFADDPQFGGWRSFARGRGLFNAEYIYERSGLPGGSIPFDWDTYAAGDAEVCVSAFDATTGEQVRWGRDDMPTMRDLFVRVRASSTMPVVMPPVTIDGHVHVDGALGPNGGIPLDAAQDAGFTRHLVVLTQEREYVKPPASRVRALRTYFRRLPSVADAIEARPGRYNAMRERVFDVESAGDAYVFAPERMPIGNSERRVPVLREVYAQGLAQARRELPAIRDFLGL